MDGGTAAWHKGLMKARAAGREIAARRREELGRRIEEIRERNRQLKTQFMDGVALPQASSVAQVIRAEELAQLAMERAAEATRRAAAMYLHSATAHERAARMHIMLAEARTGNAAEHRQRAHEHLRLAAEDRTVAGGMTGRVRRDTSAAGR